MNQTKTYERYPLWVVILINFFTLLVYLAGGYIIFKLSVITGILYLAYLALLEFNLYRKSCVHCYYYGKRCAFGKGRVAALFFKKAEVQQFCKNKFSFKDFVPQILIILVPFIVGVALLISRGYNFLIIIAIIYPVASWIIFNPIIHGKLACPFCKQGAVCCPALSFFNKGCS